MRVTQVIRIAFEYCLEEKAIEKAKTGLLMKLLDEPCEGFLRPPERKKQPTVATTALPFYTPSEVTVWKRGRNKMRHVRIGRNTRVIVRI